MKTLACLTAFLLCAAVPAFPQPPAPGFVGKLEARLGRPLSASQRAEVARASGESADGLRVCQKAFVASISRASGVAEADVWNMMPRVGADNTGFDKNMIPRLESRRGRPLTAAERSGIRDADQAKRACMAPVRDRFARRVAAACGMKPEDVAAMLPKVGL